MNSQNEIIDNLKVICQCNNVKKGTFKKLIAQGVNTIEGLQKATGAKSGECKGKRCDPRLAAMIDEIK